MQQQPEESTLFQTDEEALLAQEQFEENLTDEEMQAFEAEFEAYEEKQQQNGNGPTLASIAEFNLPTQEEFSAGNVRFIPKFAQKIFGNALYGEENQKRIQDIFIQIRPLLIDKERILYICEQRRPIINFLPDALILTTRRMIYYRNKLFGFALEDAKWTEVPVCQMYEDIWGTHILFAHKDKITFYPVRFLRRTSGHDAYTIGTEMGYRARRKARMFYYRTMMSQVPQIMINSHGTYGSEIFDGLLPKSKVPLVARGKGFVEFSEILDGADGRGKLHKITRDDVIKIQEMAAAKSAELQQEAHQQVSEEVSRAKPASGSKRIQYIDEELLEEVEQKAEKTAQQVQKEKLKAVAEQGSIVAKEQLKSLTARQAAAKSARDSRREAIRLEQEMRDKQRKTNK